MNEIKLTVAAQNVIAYWALCRLADEMYRKKDHILYTDGAPTDDLNALREFIQAIEMTSDSFASSVRANASETTDVAEVLDKFASLI